MKKILIVALSSIVLTACDRGVNPNAHPLDITSVYPMPPELTDCTVHILQPTDRNRYWLHVVRCPHSDTATTVPSDKARISVTTISE